MRKLFFCFSFLVFSFSALTQSSVSFTITKLPASHNLSNDIYLAGSFNGWNPRDDKYKFQKNSKGDYFLELRLANGDYEYKLTRGGWDKVECKKDGAGMGNRIASIVNNENIKVEVEEWADNFPPAPIASTASKNVRVWDTAFAVPQLKRKRRIWVYLPESYDENQNERYPVLYMHDGQNLFDDATSFSGEWGIDEFLDSTTLKQCIVVGIDHGGNRRLNEYNPYNNKKYGKGEGRRYVKFLAETLKPYIDKSFRTNTGKEHTFIAGSSMGGLISMFAVLEYPGLFGGVGVFSPAFWISGEKIFDDIRKKGKKVNSRIYFYGGKMEGETMIPDMLKAADILKKVSRSRISTVVREEGKHTEGQWRLEFPLFYGFL